MNQENERRKFFLRDNDDIVWSDVWEETDGYHERFETVLAMDVPNEELLASFKVGEKVTIVFNEELYETYEFFGTIKRVRIKEKEILILQEEEQHEKDPNGQGIRW